MRGQDEQVAKRAQAIHDSFIMKQQMTPADKKALMASVPAGFLKKDKAFHALSENLAEAAREGDKAKQRRLFAQMIEACTQCHALNRFPRFADQSGKRKLAYIQLRHSLES